MLYYNLKSRIKSQALCSNRIADFMVTICCLWALMHITHLHRNNKKPWNCTTCPAWINGQIDLLIDHLSLTDPQGLMNYLDGLVAKVRRLKMHCPSFYANFAQLTSDSPSSSTVRHPPASSTPQNTNGPVPSSVASQSNRTSIPPPAQSASHRGTSQNSSRRYSTGDQRQSQAKPQSRARPSQHSSAPRNSAAFQPRH
jgi:hypothetical protein